MENFKMYKKREQYDNSVVLLPTPSSNYRLTASLVLFILHSPPATPRIILTQITDIVLFHL